MTPRRKAISVVAFAAWVALMFALLYPQPHTPINSGYHERNRKQLREVSLAIFERQKRDEAQDCVPVVAVDEASEPVRGWHDMQSPLSAHEFARRDRWFDRARERWIEIQLAPIAIGRSLSNGCVRIQPHDRDRSPILVMAPIADDALDRLWMDGPPEFGPDLTQRVHDTVRAQAAKIGIDGFHVLLSNGEVEWLRIEDW